MTISNQHAVIFNRIEAISQFINIQYARAERATLKELARKIKVPYESIAFHLAEWLKYSIRYDAPANIIHKLSVFFTAENVRPSQLLEIGLTSSEKITIHQASRRFDLPGYTYIKIFKDLMLATEEGVANVKAQLETTWAIAYGCLKSFGAVQDSEWEKANIDMGLSLFGHGMIYGRQNQSFHNDHVSIGIMWGNNTIESHEQYKDIDVNNQEIVCLAPKEENVEQRAHRKMCCDALNHFVKDMAEKGLTLVSVHTQAMFEPETSSEKRRRVPTLQFVNPADAMVKITITLHDLNNVGKFILN